MRGELDDGNRLGRRINPPWALWEYYSVTRVIIHTSLARGNPALSGTKGVVCLRFSDMLHASKYEFSIGLFRGSTGDRMGGVSC